MDRMDGWKRKRDDDDGAKIKIKYKGRFELAAASWLYNTLPTWYHRLPPHGCWAPAKVYRRRSALTVHLPVHI